MCPGIGVFNCFIYYEKPHRFAEVGMILSRQRQSETVSVFLKEGCFASHLMKVYGFAVT